MDSLNVILQSFIKTFKSPRWAFGVLAGRVLPVLLSPEKVAKDLSGRQDVGLEYGLETVTSSALVLFLLSYVVAIPMMLVFALGVGGDPLFVALMFVFLFFIFLVQLAIVPAMALAGSLIGAGILWGIGKALGGKAEYAKFYGIIAPAVCLIGVVYAVLSSVMPVAMFSLSSGKDFVALMTVYIASLFAVHLLSIGYLTVFTENAHGLTKPKAFVAAALPYVPVLAINAMQALFILY